MENNYDTPEYYSHQGDSPWDGRDQYGDAYGLDDPTSGIVRGDSEVYTEAELGSYGAPEQGFEAESQRPADEMPAYTPPQVQISAETIKDIKTAKWTAGIAAALLATAGVMGAVAEDKPHAEEPAQSATPDNAGSQSVQPKVNEPGKTYKQDRGVHKIAGRNLYGDTGILGISSDGCLDGTPFPRENVNAPDVLPRRERGEEFTVNATDPKLPDLHFRVISEDAAHAVEPTDDFTKKYMKDRDC